VLDSDAGEFGGHKRIDHNTEFVTFAEGWDNRMNHMFVSVDFIFFSPLVPVLCKPYFFVITSVVMTCLFFEKIVFYILFAGQ